MTGDEPAPRSDTGGMAALQVAEAHLTTLLTATDALDSKATFLLAVNFALFGVFFGAVISATNPTVWITLMAPAVLSALLLVVGLWTVRPRDLSQNVRPKDLLLHKRGSSRAARSRSASVRVGLRPRQCGPLLLSPLR